MTKTYVVVTGEGGELASGVGEQEIGRVAQAHADRLGETVYYSLLGGADLDGDDDEDIGTAVKPHTVRCQCGEVTGERCALVGDPDDQVCVEWMPEHLRASHVAAGNTGTWPDNGAIRIWIAPECAEFVRGWGDDDPDPDRWFRLVDEADGDDPPTVIE